MSFNMKLKAAILLRWLKEESERKNRERERKGRRGVFVGSRDILIILSFSNMLFLPLYNFNNFKGNESYDSLKSMSNLL